MRAKLQEAQFARLSKLLELTDAQKPKVKKLLGEQDKQIWALQEDKSLSPTDRRTKMMEIRKENTKKMKKALTAEQFKKYEGMHQRRGQRTHNSTGANKNASK